MANINPILKNEPYKYSWLDKPPVVPNDTALVLYPHDSREHCSVYLQEDTVFPEAIKKWHLDRLVHITLRSFEFQHSFRYSFSDGVNQWVDITYKFSVAVKPDKESVKVILKNNVTDISEPILESISSLILDKSYACLELSSLESNALTKIRDLISRITYLKVQVNQTALSIDDVSKKRIDDDKADKLRKADVEAIQKKLMRDKEEAEARRKEADIAMEKAATEKQLAEIKRQQELEAQQHEITKNTKEVEAQKAYQLQQAENAAAIAEAQMRNIRDFGEENLAAIDPTYQKHIDSHQAAIDRERENKMKDLELAKEKIKLVKEMVEAGVIDDMTAGQMTQQLLLGSTAPATSLKLASSSVIQTSEINANDLSEVDRDDI